MTIKSAVKAKLMRSVTALAVLGTLAGCSTLPNLSNTSQREINWLDQNWSAEMRDEYHNMTQGTATFPVPYTWFMALEQPILTAFGNPPLMRDDEYLSRIGFIVDPASKYNIDGLPVGFARDKGAIDPVTGKSGDLIGLTCAACHTAQINYKGIAYGIDGGPATSNMDALSLDIAKTIIMTLRVPGRFDRFANRVLGAEASTAERDALRTDFLKRKNYVIKGGLPLLKYSSPFGHGEKSVTEGFNRIDALNRIGNQVFGVDLGIDKRNYAAISAPVNYPHIWDTSWFMWVQYDASIMQPMVRNSGEALGVAAQLNLINPDMPLYGSTVAVENLHEMETWLAGLGYDYESTNPPYKKVNGQYGYRGLTSPKWPTGLGKINHAQANLGRGLYEEHCQRCHLPPVDTDAFWQNERWTDQFKVTTAEEATPLVPAVACIDEWKSDWKLKWKLLDLIVANVGTDPAQWKVLTTRTVTVPESLGLVGGTPDGKGNVTLGFASALGQVVENTNNQWYKTNMPNMTAEQKDWMNGLRPNCLQAPEGYKVRPLNGVWATAPFLHNGAVPTLYDMLVPASERPKSFYLGSKKYDPVKVGYVTDFATKWDKTGLTKFDATKSGNLNTGHSFEAGYDPDKHEGPIIGPLLSEEQRMAIVEFLKTQ